MKQINVEEYKKRCNKVHNNFYNYHKWVYNVKSNEKVDIICPEHGLFKQRLSTHLSGGGCRKCSIKRNSKKNKKSPKDHIKDFIKVHKNNYQYPDKENFDSTSIIPIICKIHGTFYQKVSIHKLGSGCPKCAITNQRNHVSFNKDEVIKKAKEIHNELKYDYRYVLKQYINMKTKVDIICPAHGVFSTTMGNHIHNKTKCPKCANKISNDKKRSSVIDRISQMNIIHNYKYEYFIDKKTNAHDTILIKCPVHGLFKQQMLTHLQGWGCKKCSANRSKAEEGLFNFVKTLDKDVVSNDRSLINPKELDIVSHKHKIAIEYCGVYWHNDDFKKRNYHLNKLNNVLKKGYKLITIFENEWCHKPNIVKSRLSSLFGKIENKIYARKCVVKVIDNKIANQFIEMNHIQGKRNTTFCYGLYFNDQLVAVMTFSKNHEIIRYCNILNTVVVGGAGKLLDYHIKAEGPNNIITFADRRWSEGNLYKQLGFEFIYNTLPNFWCFKSPSIDLQSRLSFQKHKLSKKLQFFDQNLSAWENMKQNDYKRIWDCGSSKWIKKM